MSRIGRAPVEIPTGVEVKISGSKINIKGPKGFLSVEVNPEIAIENENGKILVKRSDDSRISRSLHGLSRALIFNMVKGVTEGYEKKLQLVGVGYRAVMEGKDIVLSLGYSHPCKFSAVKGIDFEVGKKGEISVRGIDKQLVGQVAADIRSLRKPDAYKGKGVKYSDEVIVKKAGKTGTK